MRRIALGHPDDFDREYLLEVGNLVLPSRFIRDFFHNQKTILPEYSNSLLQEFGPAFDRQEIENIYNGHTLKGIGRQSRYISKSEFRKWDSSAFSIRDFVLSDIDAEIRSCL